MGGSSTISNSEQQLTGIKLQTSSYGVAIPIVYGTNRISGNLLWYGNFQAIAHTSTTSSGGKGGSVTSESTTYTYTAAVMMALAEGPIAGVGTIWKGKDQTDAATLGLTLFAGTQGQAPWSWLTTYNGLSTTAAWEGIFGYLNQAAPYAQYALGYSGTAYMAASAYELDTSAAVPNHGFEVQGLKIYGAGIVDANPSDVISDFLTNGEYGAGFTPALMGDLTAYSDYCRAFGIFISPAIDKQKKAAEWLNAFMKASNTALVWSEGKLKAIPYGDAPASGNGAAYTPNTTPVYDLDDDDFIDHGSADPVKVERSTPADAYNRVQIEYLDRANQYNIEVVEAKDQYSIETYGLRSMSPISMHFICDGKVAKQVAQIVLQRALYVRNSYQFQLDWRYSVLEPMDLVTLSDAVLGLDKTPVRITEIAEDADGLLSVKAEDFPFGSASATLYPHDSGQRYQANLNTVPQNVVTPRFFEAPSSLTTTGLQVWAATGGQPTDPIYGGCRVWVSLDGISYKAVGVIYGSARFGVTTAAYPGEPLSLALSANGQLLSGSASDAANGTTMIALGEEYLAYETATLTGANAYNLTLITRGFYNTAQVSHAVGTPGARIDKAIGKSDDLDMSMIGKTIYFKFTAFNVYGGGEQSLAAVTAYSYPITGYMTKLPPSNVASMTASVDAGLNVTLAWPAVVDLDIGEYEIRDGASWATAAVVGSVKGTTFKIPLVSGAHTYQVKAIDVNGNESAVAATASITVSTSAAVSALSVSPVTVAGSAGTESPAFDISWTAANSTILQTTAVEYKKSAGSSWIAYSNVTPPTTSAQITGIEPGTSYDVRVAELYNNGIKSAYATVSNTASLSAQTVASVPWTGVSGSGKPADNATVNNVTYGATAPVGANNGDVWVDTGVTPNITRVRVLGVWRVGANYSTNTNQLTDGAGLGTTASWAGVSGTGKPADYATVGAPAGTNVGTTAASDIETRVTSGLTAGSGVVQSGKVITGSVQDAAINAVTISSNSTSQAITYPAGPSALAVLSFAVTKALAASNVILDVNLQTYLNLAHSSYFTIELQRNIAGTWTTIETADYCLDYQVHSSFTVRKVDTSAPAGSLSYRVYVSLVGTASQTSVIDFVRAIATEVKK